MNEIPWRYLRWVKSVRIRRFFGLHFPAFGLNTERYSVSLHIQSECEKIRIRKTPNTDTFYAVLITWLYHEKWQNLLLFNCIEKYALLCGVKIVNRSPGFIRSVLNSIALPSLPVLLEVLSDFKYCLTLRKEEI